MKKRDILIIIGALIGALLLTLGQFGTKVMETGAWGLHFSENGQPPSAPANKETLSQLGAVYMGDSAEKVLYLTFDAGYENGYTPAILDVLKKHNTKAAFFLVGDYLERNADLVRRMVAEGHIVANHTASHPDMSKITDREAFSKELTEVETLFREITGKELPRYYRPPQGIYSEENLKLAKEMGYQTVFWSLAYADWDNQKQPSQAYAMEKLTSRTHNGAVVLLHATSKTNAEILDQLLTHWESQGYRIETIDKLFSA